MVKNSKFLNERILGLKRLPGFVNSFLFIELWKLLRLSIHSVVSLLYLKLFRTMKMWLIVKIKKNPMLQVSKEFLQTNKLFIDGVIWKENINKH